jgi:ribose 1,5-bisphosphokinase
MSGLIYLCGPSGAGKDAVLSLARPQLEGHPRLAFGQRVMTRPAEPASPHRTVSPAEFAALERQGGFCMVWSAHGYRYALERHLVDLVARGTWVVVSASREQAPAARALFPRSKVVVVTAPEPLVGDRLRRRGRDGERAIAEREERNRRLSDFQGDLEIVNRGELVEAVDALVRAVRGWLGPR